MLQPYDFLYLHLQIFSLNKQLVDKKKKIFRNFFLLLLLAQRPQQLLQHGAFLQHITVTIIEIKHASETSVAISVVFVESFFFKIHS